MSGHGSTSCANSDRMMWSSLPAHLINPQRINDLHLDARMPGCVDTYSDPALQENSPCKKSEAHAVAKTMADGSENLGVPLNPRVHFAGDGVAVIAGGRRLANFSWRPRGGWH